MTCKLSLPATSKHHSSPPSTRTSAHIRPRTPTTPACPDGGSARGHADRVPLHLLVSGSAPARPCRRRRAGVTAALSGPWRLRAPRSADDPAPKILRAVVGPASRPFPNFGMRLAPVSRPDPDPARLHPRSLDQIEIPRGCTRRSLDQIQIPRGCTPRSLDQIEISERRRDRSETHAEDCPPPRPLAGGFPREGWRIRNRRGLLRDLRGAVRDLRGAVTRVPQIADCAGVSAGIGKLHGCGCMCW